MIHDDVIKWKHFPRNWSFVRGIQRSPVNSPHKGQWRGALMFSLICVWINDRVNTHEAGDLRRHRAHYDVIVMSLSILARSISSPDITTAQVCYCTCHRGTLTHTLCLFHKHITSINTHTCHSTFLTGGCYNSCLTGIRFNVQFFWGFFQV